VTGQIVHQVDVAHSSGRDSFVRFLVF
jgi:hypothetical protein